MLFVLLTVSMLLLLLGLRKRKTEGHWTTCRKAREKESPSEKEIEDLIVVGVTVSGSQVVMAVMAGALSGVVGIYVLTGRADIALLGLSAGVLTPRAWLSWKVNNRRKLFDTQLEVVLNHMAAALRAGANVQQTWEQAALGAHSPAKDVLEHVVKIARSGRSMTVALDETGRVVKSRDLRIIAAATTLCAQTGGDLAAVYNRLAEALRDKQTFKSELDANMAEGKLTANALVAIPFVFIAVFRRLSPEYMSPLFNTNTGFMVFLFCVGMIVAGWFVLRKMMQLDY